MGASKISCSNHMRNELAENGAVLERAMLMIASTAA
jgi:hypothetical protein